MGSAWACCQKPLTSPLLGVHISLNLAFPSEYPDFSILPQIPLSHTHLFCTYGMPGRIGVIQIILPVSTGWVPTVCGSC